MTSSAPQPGIAADLPSNAGFLFLDLAPGAHPAEAALSLGSQPHPEHLVIGLGGSLTAALGRDIDGFRPLPPLEGPSVSIPSTDTALFVRVVGDDPGHVLHRERDLLARLPAFRVVDRVQGFVYGEGRDLSGYLDGTENPTGEHADSVAFRAAAGPGLDGSSVVAAQRWVHDLDTFEGFAQAHRDAVIGREVESNDEIGDAAPSAHVKRAAQEDFEPEAFLLRRSMPWRDQRGEGLVFVSFSATLGPFEAVLRRMVGLEDGVVDALFSFTRPVTGGAWWCPPLRGDRLDLRALGL